MDKTTKIITILIILIGILIVAGCLVIVQYIKVLSTSRFDKINDILNMARILKWKNKNNSKCLFVFAISNNICIRFNAVAY